jgi:hypothetical protein
MYETQIVTNCKHTDGVNLWGYIRKIYCQEYYRSMQVAISSSKKENKTTVVHL